MVLSILVIIFALLIAYWHYNQGFLSSAISAVCAVTAAMMAFAYYEPLAIRFASGKFVDLIPGALLCGIFFTVYTVLRIVIDLMIPGNVRLPVVADKIGAAVLGLIVAVMALGTVVVAAQHMPFSPTIVYSSRYEVATEQEAIVPDPKRGLNRDIRDRMTAAKFEPAKFQPLLLPVDDWVVGLADYCSAGSLSGQVSLREVHPALIDELFGQRIGVQTGAKRTAVNNDTREDVKVVNVFTGDIFPQVDDSISGMREPKTTVGAVAKPSGGNVFLVVRVQFETAAADSDRVARFSTGATRLNIEGTNYHPVGTMHGGKVMLVEHYDDFIHVDTSGDDAGAIDIVFDVPKPRALNGETVRDGLFLEVKRYARVDLGGKKITAGGPTASAMLSDLRKREVLTYVADPVAAAAGNKKKADVPPAPTPAPTPASNAPTMQPGGQDLPPVAPIPGGM